VNPTQVECANWYSDQVLVRFGWWGDSGNSKFAADGDSTAGVADGIPDGAADASTQHIDNSPHHTSSYYFAELKQSHVWVFDVVILLCMISWLARRTRKYVFVGNIDMVRELNEGGFQDPEADSSSSSGKDKGDTSTLKGKNKKKQHDPDDPNSKEGLRRRRLESFEKDQQGQKNAAGKNAGAGRKGDSKTPQQQKLTLKLDPNNSVKKSQNQMQFERLRKMKEKYVFLPKFQGRSTWVERFVGIVGILTVLWVASIRVQQKTIATMVHLCHGVRGRKHSILNYNYW
jgi:hypothetical protein